MGSQLGGYRHREYITAAGATAAVDFDRVREGHKVYVEVLSACSSKANADLVVSVDAAGDLHPVWHVANFSANVREQQHAGFWVFAGERLHWYWSDIAAADTLEMTAIGVEKWGEGNG